MVTREKSPSREAHLIIPDKVYGEIKIDDPLVAKLINSPSFQRLKGIGQMGVYGYALPIDTTRFEHSVGVYHLLGRFGADREEQIAGLVHDVSHPVFSHVIDHLLGNGVTQDFQDEILEQFIKNCELGDILERYSLPPDRIADHGKWPMLDRPLPDLCADRLDYGLRDGLACGVLKPEDIKEVLDNIQIHKGQWVFTDPDVAKFWMEKTIGMAKYWWAPRWGVLQFKIMARALNRGLETQVLTRGDLFLRDQEVWDKLESSSDPIILRDLTRVRNAPKLRVEPTNEPTDLNLQSKYRGQDPLVKIGDCLLVRTSVLFPRLKELAEYAKAEIENPRYVRLLD